MVSSAPSPRGAQHFVLHILNLHPTTPHRFLDPPRLMIPFILDGQRQSQANTNGNTNTKAKEKQLSEKQNKSAAAKGKQQSKGRPESKQQTKAHNKAKGTQQSTGRPKNNQQRQGQTTKTRQTTGVLRVLAQQTARSPSKRRPTHEQQHAKARFCGNHH